MNEAGMGILGKAPSACYGRSGHLEDHAQEEWFMSSFDLLLQSSSAFDWNQGLLVLAVTAVVLAGLVLVEAVHQARDRLPRRHVQRRQRSAVHHRNQRGAAPLQRVASSSGSPLGPVRPPPRLRMVCKVSGFTQRWPYTAGLACPSSSTSS